MRWILIFAAAALVLALDAAAAPYPGKTIEHIFVRANESRVIDLEKGKWVLLTLELPTGDVDVSYARISQSDPMSQRELPGMENTEGVVRLGGRTYDSPGPTQLRFTACQTTPDVLKRRVLFLTSKVRETLREGDDTYARVLAERFGEYPEIIPDLLAVLKSDEPAGVKKCVAMGLAAFPGQLTKDFLAMLKGSDNEMKRCAVEFFTALPDPKQGESTVLSLLKRADAPDDVRKAALEFALRRCDRKACSQALGRFVKSEVSAQLRAMAASAADHRDIDSKETSIVSLLIDRAKNDTDPGVRTAAIGSLTRLRGKWPQSAVTAMREVLKADGAPSVRLEAGRYLLSADTKRSVTSILEMTKDAAEPALRVLRCAALRESGDKQAADELLSIYQTAKEPPVRAEALKSLVKVKQPGEMASALLQAVRPEEPDEVAFIGATYLGRFKLGGEGAVEALAEVLLSRKRSDKVRQAAAGSLGYIGGGDAVKALEKALRKAGSREVRLAVADALWTVETEEALSVLEQARYREKSPEVNRFLKEAVDNMTPGLRRTR
jgi:hypothetical protein